MQNGKKLWAGLAVVVICFVIIGCGTIYKVVGLDEQQAATQQAKDAEVIISVVEQGRELAWQLATLGVAAVGTIVTGFLGKWLKNEKALTAAVIAGVEKTDKAGVKASIRSVALDAGVEGLLHKRVKKLTE